jgi:hypothetical protein
VDPIQEQFEQTVGDEFIRWFNQKNNSDYKFSHRGSPAPDLTYSSGSLELSIEISSAYFDGACARFQWQNARKIQEAPSEWRGRNFEDQLIKNISSVIAEKSIKQYGQNCYLVIYVRPDLTSSEELISLLPSLSLPDSILFSGIYILGYFQEGYRVIPIVAA